MSFELPVMFWNSTSSTWTSDSESDRAKENEKRKKLTTFRLLQHFLIANMKYFYLPKENDASESDELEMLSWFEAPVELEK